MMNSCPIIDTSFEDNNSLFRSFSMDSSDEEAYQYHTLHNIVGNNKDMLSFVEQFNNTTQKTLDIHNSLEQCLTNQHIITQVAEKDNIDDITSNYKELVELSNLFQSHIDEHGSVLEYLKHGERKFEKKLKWNKKLTKVSNCIFVLGFVSVLTFSVVATAISAPPFVIALASGLLVPIGSVQRWSAQICDRRKKANKKKMEITTSMKIATRKSKEKLVEILTVVNHMKDEIGYLSEYIDQLITKEEKVQKQGIDDVKNKVELVMETNHKLSRDAAQYCCYIRGKGKAIFKKIIN